MIRFCPRILLAAPGSGSGKTMMTCGLLQAFLNRGLSCRAFKCGPDYIDPMFHKYVLGLNGGNLDTFFLEQEQVRTQFVQMAETADISVIEGVMGYYDGMGGDSVRASSYEIACTVDAPVVLVIDCKGASLSLAATVKGFLEFKTDSHIKGVILNRISAVMAERLSPIIEEMGLTVFGYLPECEEGKLDSRHLGLVLPQEIGDFRNQLERLAKKMEQTMDIDGLFELGQSAEALLIREPELLQQSSQKKVVIGVARDEAFCFYYQENLKLLEDMGALLVPFSPIRDSSLPEGIQGVVLGGGYPELYVKELSENHSMLEDIKGKLEAGMPVLAECGGFLYLQDELETGKGVSGLMVGFLHGRGYPTKKLTRFGYVEITPYEDTALLKTCETIRGHEFHYWDSTDNGTDMRAGKPNRASGWDCIHVKGYALAGFPHLYYPSAPELVKRWIKGCRDFGVPN